MHIIPHRYRKVFGYLILSISTIGILMIVPTYNKESFMLYVDEWNDSIHWFDGRPHSKSCRIDEVNKTKYGFGGENSNTRIYEYKYKYKLGGGDVYYGTDYSSGKKYNTGDIAEVKLHERVHYMVGLRKSPYGTWLIITIIISFIIGLRLLIPKSLKFTQNSKNGISKQYKK